MTHVPLLPHPWPVAGITNHITTELMFFELESSFRTLSTVLWAAITNGSEFII